MDKIKLPHAHGEEPISPALAQTLVEQVEDFQAVAATFRCLGDVTRLRIFWLLYHCEQCVLNIAALMAMSSPAVSHHLRELREGGLIVSRREGKEVYYRAADSAQSGLLHKMIEQGMQIVCPEWGGEAELAATVRAVHKELTENMERRITIEELSRRYWMNPTTLKAAFKAVYGNSIAAHMREHRMERAAELLRETEQSVAAIARAVGYESQSRFSAAFRETYGLLPTEYRAQTGHIKASEGGGERD